MKDDVIPQFPSFVSGTRTSHHQLTSEKTRKKMFSILFVTNKYLVAMNKFKLSKFIHCK